VTVTNVIYGVPRLHNETADTLRLCCCKPYAER